ncbi:MAG: lipoate--protein ligase [Desulfovibrio sp.]|nr:lipoate--protein ligase [Desulfovibrio sp.]
MLLIEVDSLDAATHFAVEQYCMEYIAGDDPIMLIWQTSPCVMPGRNQVVAAEVHPRTAERLGIQIVRRPSGGGAIYTDEGTLQCTVIVPYGSGGGDVREVLRNALAEPLRAALRDLGVPAEIQGRNDLLAGDRKIAGLAQWVWKNHLCSHASLLYRADLSVLGEILRVDEGKIASRAIRSVRGRVANISEYMRTPPPTSVFKGQLKAGLSGAAAAEEYVLSPAQLEEIRAIREAKYGAYGWTYGATPEFDYHFSRRFTAGIVEVAFNVVRGNIGRCNIHGDFMAVRPVRELEKHLEGLAYDPGIVRDSLADFDLTPYLGEVSREQLLSCLFA